jgi:DNA repair protein RecO (recombination protein O)
MLEAAERLVTEEREPAVQQYLLLVGGLRALTAGEKTPRSVLDSYLLRSLSVAGYAPSFDACALCGLEGPHRWFNPSAGGVLCSTCRIPGSATVTPEVLTLLSALLTGDWDTVALADDRAARDASGLVAAYLTWHVERGLRSLAYVERP